MGVQRLTSWIVTAGLMGAPAISHASCESIVIVQSRELEFWYTDATSDGGIVKGDSADAAHFERLAHALATAYRAWSYMSVNSCEAGTPPRHYLHLQARSTLEKSEQAEPHGRKDIGAYPGLAEHFAEFERGPACSLWTCDVVHLSRATAAESAAALLRAPRVPQWLYERSDPDSDVRWFHESCSGDVEVGAFLDPQTEGPGRARVCYGLFFSPQDAEATAERLELLRGQRIRLRRIRVDGALLRRILQDADEIE